MTISSAHQGARSQYQQNAQFLNQLNKPDRPNLNYAQSGIQGIFNGTTSEASININEQNINLNNGGIEGQFQYVQVPKSSSRMQIYETLNNSNASDNTPNGHLGHNKQMIVINNQNYKNSNFQNINNTNQQSSQQRDHQQEPKELVGQQIRNGSQPEYKQFRKRVIAKQDAQKSLRVGSENQDIDSFNSQKQLINKTSNQYLIHNKQPQQQLQISKGQHLLQTANNQNYSQSSLYQMQTPSGNAPQTPQQSQFQVLNLRQNYFDNNLLKQKQQLLKMNQFNTQVNVFQQIKHEKQSTESIQNDLKQQQLSNLFTNQLIQNKSIMARNQSEESQRYIASAGQANNASQQQMRNSQQLVEAAEQLLVQKQMYLQMIQNMQTNQKHPQNGQNGISRLPQTHPNMLSVQEEFKTLQEYQRAFNIALKTSNDMNVVNRSANENQTDNKRNVNSSMNESSMAKNKHNDQNLKNSLEEDGLSKALDYCEFKDYLIQKQFEQEGDYPFHFAHSKKQRELLKAKEFSQQFIFNQEQHPTQYNKQTNNYTEKDANKKDKKFKSEKNRKTKKINDLSQLNQECTQKARSPRGMSGSKRSKRKANQLTGSSQQNSQHARSQSGNQCRERHINNIGMNSGLLIMQQSNQDGTNKPIENSQQESPDHQNLIYRSNTSNHSNQNANQIVQKDLSDSKQLFNELNRLSDNEGINRDQTSTQVDSSQRISSSQPISANTATTTFASQRGSLPQTRDNVPLNNTGNQTAGESRSSPASSEMVKNTASDANEAANNLAPKQTDKDEKNQAQDQLVVEDQQLSKVSEESINDEGKEACGPLVESEDGDPEMLDAIDEEFDGEGDLGELEGDSEENDGDGDELQDQDNATKTQKFASQNTAQGKGGKARKDNNKKIAEEEQVIKEKKPAVPRAPWRLKKEEKAKEAADKAKAEGQGKPKKNNKILASMPANWAEEEKKFFDANFDYDPQFVYDSPATNKRFLKMFPAPKFEYLPQAKQIIDKFLETYGSESNYFETEGAQLTEKEQVEKYIHDYLDELGPEVKSVARINFSSKNVASTSVTYDNWTNKIRINVQLPIQYREGRMLGVLHHEIGSHFLRRFNEVQQVWHNERKKFGLKSTVTIEEGSGCINMMLEQAKDPNKFTFLFKPALNYYMCCKASELSFKDLFNDLAKYVDNPRQRYKYVLRVKRGLNDTSQPGGLYKDQVYLEGALKLLEHRKDVDWHGFYSFKGNLEDLKRKKLMKQLKTDDIVLPKFVENAADYVKCLDVIAKHNFID